MGVLFAFRTSIHFAVIFVTIASCVGIDFRTDVELHSPSGSVKVVTFQYSTTESTNESLEASVLRFCKAYDVQHKHCIALFLNTLDFMIDEFSRQFNDGSGKFNSSTNAMSIDFYDKLKTSLGVDAESAFMETYNAVNRYSWAYRSERLNAFRANLTSTDSSGNAVDNSPTIGLDSDEVVENEIDELIWSQFIESHHQQQYHPQYLRMNDHSNFPRVCFIHSCTLPDQDISILLEMLETIYTSGLAVTLTKLWIINHGTPLNQESLQKISEYNERIMNHHQQCSMNLSSNNSSVIPPPPLLPPVFSLIERSTDMSRFEMTTLRHLHRFALQINDNHNHSNHNHNNHTLGIHYDHSSSTDLVINQPKDIQILYLHTKGITYKDSIRQSYTHDWRRVMMYFLVENHSICYHLLASTLYDILGINYHDNIPNGHEAHFAGNFWWISAQYVIHQIGDKLISLDSPKTVAELWLLKPKRIARVYNLHSSLVRHLYQPYPRELYAEDAHHHHHHQDHKAAYRDKIRKTAFAIIIRNNSI